MALYCILLAFLNNITILKFYLFKNLVLLSYSRKDIKLFKKHIHIYIDLRVESKNCKMSLKIYLSTYMNIYRGKIAYIKIFLNS